MANHSRDMGIFLGIIVLICGLVGIAALLVAAFGMIIWIRWRIVLIPFFRMSEKMKIWYKREQRKDWYTRSGQRLIFAAGYIAVQLPAYFIVFPQAWSVRTILLGVSVVLLVRAVWSFTLRHTAHQQQRIADTATASHDAFHDVTPALGAKARETLMNIFTAERIIRLGAYTFLTVAYFAVLAWDGGASSALEDLVVR